MKKLLGWLKTNVLDTWLGKEVKKLLAGFENSSTGYAAKKLTAFALMYCIVKLHNTFILALLADKHWDLFITLVATDFGFIAVLFGINEYDKKSKRKDEKTETPIADSQPTDGSGAA
jgi:hypothetical protein